MKLLDALVFPKMPETLQKMFPDILWKGNEIGKNLYLTFDDGPQPEVTDFVLQQLKLYNAKATFFCIGKNVETQPNLFERILKEGHSTGNHSFNHLNGWDTSTIEYLQNVQLYDDLMENQYPEINTKLFRPPYGKLKVQQYKKLKEKKKIVLWDVLSYDFKPDLHSEQVLKNVTDHAGEGSVIVFHDSAKAFSHIKYCLPRVLEYYSKKGFDFKAL